MTPSSYIMQIFNSYQVWPSGLKEGPHRQEYIEHTHTFSKYGNFKLYLSKSLFSID